MPRMYPASVRRQIVARLREGEPVAAVAADTGICEATLFRWKHQAPIDAGVVEGIPSVEADELAAARKRVAVLEAELALTRDACELFNSEAVVPPKRRRAIADGLHGRGGARRCRGSIRATVTTPNGRRPKPLPTARRASASTVVVHGSVDPMVPPRHGRAMAATIQKVRSIVTDGVEHALPPAIWRPICRGAYRAFAAGEPCLVRARMADHRFDSLYRNE
jgi:transposase-like protein